MTNWHENLVFDKIYLASLDLTGSQEICDQINNTVKVAATLPSDSALESLDLKNSGNQLLIVDLSNSKKEIIETLIRMLAENERLQVLLLVQETQLETYRFLFASGQADFLVPPFSAEILRCRLQALNSRALLFRTTATLSDKDPLTSLLSRQSFIERVMPAYSSAIRQQLSLSFSLISVERLDGINRRFGQKVGDQVLKRLAEVIVNRLRTTDYACRYSGRSFGVVTVNMRPSYMETYLDDILLSFLSSDLKAGLVTLDIKASIGGTRDVGDDIEAMLNKAELALFTSREKGANQITIL
ncbi:diguanylate cyclase [Sneathiella sp. P13V-1]|uniref:GGDEF domain-containing protein n=1 Tax=Sneathiella sp. P13V-1 TaxID=2697366 RepID=UPI00187B699A|nr:GGDEF domain-containing protein [Sneathiella sp. P13V-1]MBE7637708.1 diguanylate cyclase [Sneathiella sp. P13V-1]